VTFLNLRYQTASIDNLAVLIKTRIQVLRAANKLADEVDMSMIEQESYHYYKDSLTNGTHIAYLVYKDALLVGAGGVSFYRVMPTYENPTGEKAYIMNMYTIPQYRKQGIAIKMLDYLVKESKARNVTFISLEATEMGKPLYEKYGFVEMENEMCLPIL